MATRKYFRITEVTKICGVDEGFVLRLEHEELVVPVIRRREKVYPIDQVDRVRVAHILMEELGVNLAGIEVALNMRQQMARMQQDFEGTIRALLERLGD
ncbi:MAG: MerR family transcriptional regulator [Myxococcales bacterium]|nr:MerR family transcriptional regulator [Myxococcales bacterium]